MSKHRNLPAVNAGSMADIAFLLLIFFLVTAAIDQEQGLPTTIPKASEKGVREVAQHNLFEIAINADNQLMVQGEVALLQNLRSKLIAFLDNGGLSENEAGHCAYCRGEQEKHLSESPQKAIVSLTTNVKSSYATYVAVQNEIEGAYNYLRNREGQRLFKEDYKAMVQQYRSSNRSQQDKQILKEQIHTLRDQYPKQLIELDML